jgi:hypothetical protein
MSRLRFLLLCGTSIRKPQSAAQTPTSVLAVVTGLVASRNMCLTRNQYTLKSLHIPDSTATHKEHGQLPASPSLSPDNSVQQSYDFLDLKATG